MHPKLCETRECFSLFTIKTAKLFQRLNLLVSETKCIVGLNPLYCSCLISGGCSTLSVDFVRFASNPVATRFEIKIVRV